jgi:glutamate 5-kinase
VATEELRFGDNDQLAALVVNAIGADLLVLLTDWTACTIATRASRAQRIPWCPR